MHSKLKTIMVFGLVLLSTCAKKPLVDETRGLRPVPPQYAEWVSALPPQYLYFKQPLRIEFAKPVVPSSQVKTVEKRALLTLSPAAEGDLVWVARDVLEFQPKNTFPMSRSFEAKLHLSLLAPKLAEPLTFSFETLGNEVLAFDAEFKPDTTGKKYTYIMEGRVVFSQPVTRQALEKSIYLRLAGSSLGLTLTGPEQGTEFAFKSSEVVKDNRVKEYALGLKDKDLELSGVIERDVVLEKRSAFKVMKMDRVIEETQSGLVLHFSDLLSKTQTPDGFLKFEPAVVVKTKSVDNKLYVFGPFEYGKKYSVAVQSGIKSFWDESLTQPFEDELFFEDFKPQIRFLHPGVYLPSANRGKIAFQTINVRKVKVHVLKVFASNLGQFLQTERLQSNGDNASYYRQSENLRRVGVTVKEEVLDIGDTKNVWLTSELDMQGIFGQEKKGLFLVTLHFSRDEAMYEDEEAKTEAEGDDSYWGDTYYNNPYKTGYYERFGAVCMPVILSDLGLTVKKAHKNILAYVNHFSDGRPLSGIRVKLMTFQNQPVAEQTTNGQGLAEFKNIEEEVYYVQAEQGAQRSVVKLEDMAWNLSGYDVGGMEAVPGGVRAFLYTDRGVYRPGDTVHLCVIARNQDNTFPQDHPVTLKLENPRGQTALETTSRKGVDGFYHFEITTKPQDPTGDWVAHVAVGDAQFQSTIKIETVVPNRLKVMIKPDQPFLSPDQRTLEYSIQSKYLFGAPAADLRVEVMGELQNYPLNYPAYPNFTFTHEGISYQPLRSTLLDSSLNEQGETSDAWSLPDLKVAPSALRAQLSAKVYEKGGRYTMSQQEVMVYPYDYFVGLERINLDYGYLQIPTQLALKTILVTPQGAPASGRTLEYRLYRNTQWWWWEYRNDERDQLKFKSQATTELVASGSVVTRKLPVPIKLDIRDSGAYLLEVQHPDGHTAGYFFHAAAWWGAAAGKQADAGSVVIKSDKESYTPGEVAAVRFPVPKTGRVLLTVEAGKEVLFSRWETLRGHETQKVMKIDITEAMLPTAYVSLSIFQPHAQTKNDLPLRMYGVLPLKVEALQTKKNIVIQAPGVLEPEKEFEVKVASEDGSPFQATIAVVDVGLLDLTGFRTPDPWNYFYQKVRLGVQTFDLFGQVIGANPEDIHKLFAIGGGEDISGELSPVQAKRFKPVALFQGPLRSDEKGRIKVKFTMPNYIGAVRIMAVAAEQSAYGRAQEEVAVKKDLMIQPTLPRVLGPNETFILPVNVIAMKSGVGTVEVAVKVSGPLDVSGENRKTVILANEGDEMVTFELKTPMAIGTAQVEITAHAKGLQAYERTEIAVRPSSPRITKTLTQKIDKGASAEFIVPGDGIEGSNQATISVKRLPNLDLEHRLHWLIHYPYGCIEQTTSSVFPQLHLKAFFNSSKREAAEIDRNINAGIERLKSFQLPSGGFSYWPGEGEVSGWGSNYAGHFLLEAREQGYAVPDTLIDAWKQFQHSMALKNEGDLHERIYRVYTLALAKDPDFGAMNLLKENDLANMDNMGRWMLAAAYKLAGSGGVGEKIMEKAGLEAKEYRETGGTFGSRLRDEAIILESLLLFGRMNQAQKLFEDLGAAMSAEGWESTQTIAYSLLAMGKYLKKVELDYAAKKPRLKGVITLPDGKRVPFNTSDLVFKTAVENGFGKPLTVQVDPGNTSQFIYANLDWSGVPLESETAAEASKLSLEVSWFDEDGNSLSVDELKQGMSFWGKIDVARMEQQEVDLKNVALVQILPSGWEIENLRLTGEQYPAWVQNLSLSKETYLDIRDDRLMWFFDMNTVYYWQQRSSYTFVFKINAVTAGEFTLPATKAEAMYDNSFRAAQPGKRVRVHAAQ